VFTRSPVIGGSLFADSIVRVFSSP